MSRIAYALGALVVAFAVVVAYLMRPSADPAKDGGPFIVAGYSAGEPPLDPLDPAWTRVAPVAVSTYPQVSVAPGMELSGASAVNVRALYGAKEMALHLEWPDASPAKEHVIGAFADGAAVQWPVRYGPGETLPYVGMGHPAAPVALWLWRADDSVETLAAEGFGTLTAQPGDGVKARGMWTDGIWRVVFARPLRAPPDDHRMRLDPNAQGLVPVAFAVWNGEARERNGLKRLSAWHVLRFEKAKVGEAYARQLTGPSVAGDADKGRRLMTEKGCADCHAFPGNPARPSVAPDLTYAGGIHPAFYIMESITNPSAVVVPGKGYAIMQEGKLQSLMPPFAGSEAELRDIAAFLRSLR